MILVLDVNPRRIKATLTSLELHGIQVHHMDVHRFPCQVWPCSSNANFAGEADDRLSPHTLLCGLDAILQQIQAKVGRRLSLVRAIALIVEVDRLPPILLSSDTRAVLENLSADNPLQAQLALSSVPSASERQTPASKGKVSRCTDVGHSGLLSEQRAQKAAVLQATAATTGKAHQPDDFVYQCLRILISQKNANGGRQGWHENRLMTSSTFLRSALTGRSLDTNSIEAALTGMCDVQLACWDRATLDAMQTVLGYDDDIEPLFGKITPFGCHSEEGVTVGSWTAKRFGFTPTCIVVQGLPACMASFLSFVPASSDAAIGFGRSDEMLVPSKRFVAHAEHHTLPNPMAHLQVGSMDMTAGDGHAPWLVRVRIEDAGHVRNLIRQVFAKTWRAFKRLVKAVSPGGTVGLDNKLFLFFIPTGPAKGLRRYEQGTRVSDFSDLRASPRCIIEGQALALRRAYAEIKSMDHIDKKEALTMTNGYFGAASSLNFDLFDSSVLPSRWLTWGKPAGNACLANVFCDVLGKSFFVGQEDLHAAALSDEQGCQQSETAMEHVSRAALGACYLAAFVVHCAGMDAKEQAKQDFSAFVKSSSVPQVGIPAASSFSGRLGQLDICAQHLPSSDDQTTPRPWWRGRAWPGEDAVVDTTSTGSEAQERHLQRGPVEADQPEGSATLLTATMQGNSSPSSSSGSCFQMSLSNNSTMPSDEDGTNAHYEHDNRSAYHHEAEQDIYKRADGRTVEGQVICSAESDSDLWMFYATMLEEYVRLSDMIQRMGDM